MAQSLLSVATIRRRFVRVTALLLAIVTTTTLISLSVGYSYRHDTKSYQAKPGSYVARRPPTAAQQAATLAVTALFRRQVVVASERFSAATTALALDVAHGDRVGAQQQYLIAQGAFDVLRPTLTSQVSSLTPLDTLVTNQTPGRAPTGLHGIEKSLWSGSLASALGPAQSLASVGPNLEFVLFRTILTPSTICARVIEALSWTVEDVIDAPQEQFSARDLVDVHGVVDSALVTIDSLQLLARLVDPSAARTMQLRARTLFWTLNQLRITTPDSKVPLSTWRTLAQQIDALELPLGVVAGAVESFGSGRPYA